MARRRKSREHAVAAPEKIINKINYLNRFPSRSRLLTGLLVAGLLALFLGAGYWVYRANTNPGPAQGDPPAMVDATRTAQHVGSAACASCHAQQLQAWQGSHHQLAMQQASQATVLGNFENVNFRHSGAASKRRYLKRMPDYAFLACMF